MSKTGAQTLRRGWTTGACATAAVRASLIGLWGAGLPGQVTIRLPRGETPEFDVAHFELGEGWAEAGIVKDAGDDPDVTHGAMIIARVTPGGHGIRFAAGEGVGTVTRAGLPIGVGEPAINPVPREMMVNEVHAAAAEFGKDPDVLITISVPNGAAIAQKTWNPRLGIVGGLSILGTTGIVRPFSCAAWIASIHRGVDVARAAGLGHVAGCTGATSERVVQSLYGLPDHAMLDMGDFAGGLLKYLRKHPVGRLTIGGGIGKLTKLAQGAMDLHSGRSQVDFNVVAEWGGDPSLARSNTMLEAVSKAGPGLAELVAQKARKTVLHSLGDKAGSIAVDVVVIDRAGEILGRAGP